jgi:hypothetical protein
MRSDGDWFSSICLQAQRFLAVLKAARFERGRAAIAGDPDRNLSGSIKTCGPVGHGLSSRRIKVTQTPFYRTRLFYTAMGFDYLSSNGNCCRICLIGNLYMLCPRGFPRPKD